MQLVKNALFALAFGNGSADTKSIQEIRELADRRIASWCAIHPIEQNSRQALTRHIHQLIYSKSDDGRVPNIAIPDIINHIERKIIFGHNNSQGFIELPRELRLPGIFQLESYYQDDWWTCGYRALFNARAIETCMAGELSAEAIAREAVKYERNIDASLRYPERARTDVRLGFEQITYGQMLEFDQIMEVNSRLLKYADGKPDGGIVAVPNVYYLGFSPEMNQIWLEDHRANLGNMGDIIERGLAAQWGSRFRIRNPLDINTNNALLNGQRATPEEVNEARQNAINTHQELAARIERGRQNAYRDMMAQFDRIANQIDRNQISATHFICNLNGGKKKLGLHWILISIIKRANRGPVMIIMDSKNWQAGPAVTEFALFLWRIFINRPAPAHPLAAPIIPVSAQPAAATVVNVAQPANSSGGRLSPHAAASKDGQH